MMNAFVDLDELIFIDYDVHSKTHNHRTSCFHDWMKSSSFKHCGRKRNCM